MILAVEDPLSEAVLRKLVHFFAPQINIVNVLGLRGNDYLKGKARLFNQTARSFPVFLLTDLDSPKTCAPILIQNWLGGPPNPGLLFRVAEMEVEAWVMADRASFSKEISVPLMRVPMQVDTIPNPKQFLVNLSRRSNSAKIRADMVPLEGSTSQVGPGFNPRLISFVSLRWQPNSAIRHSSSLKRAVKRLKIYYEGSR